MSSKDSIWNGFLDVVVLPPPEVRDYAIAVSTELHQHGTPWALGLEERRPHLSLFHFPLSQDYEVEDVTAVLANRLSGGHLFLISRSAACRTRDKPRQSRSNFPTNRCGGLWIASTSFKSAKAGQPGMCSAKWQ
jgi:hypothetical protein